jgi:hypothetical protein
MRVAIAAVGCAALAYVFCCQNAGAAATTGTAIKEAAAAGSLATQTRYHRFYWHGLSQVLSAAGHRSLCLPALLALERV